MAPITRKIFIDSSILVAFVDRADPNNLKAIKIMDDLAIMGYQPYTSLQIIMESYVVLAREVGMSIASEFLQSILQSGVEILFPQKADLIATYRMLQVNRDKQISLRETLNATLMQKRGIMQILTFTYWHSLFGTYVSSLST